jgi:hypothetical protein
MRGFLLGLLCAVLVFAGFAVVARTGLHGPVAPDTLAVSLDRSIGTGGMADAPDCERRGAHVWRCDVVEPEQSGGATYRVTTETGGSCWTAERIEDYSEGPMPRRARDCVHLWQWSEFDLLPSA